MTFLAHQVIGAMTVFIDYFAENTPEFTPATALGGLKGDLVIPLESDPPVSVGTAP